MGIGGDRAKAAAASRSHAEIAAKSGALRRDGDVKFANGEEFPSVEEDDNNPPHAFVLCLVLVAYHLYCARSVLTLFNLLVALATSCIWVEPASAFLHICLDNPNFNDYPGLGPHCRGFQRHHLDPAAIAKRKTMDFAMEPSVPYMIVGAQGLIFANPYYKLWFGVAYIPTLLMMFSHRWAHMSKKDRPLIAVVLRNAGLIMSDKHHRGHHTTYDCNFAIFMGWSNDLFFNWYVKHPWGLHWEDRRWLPMALCFFLSPSLVGTALYAAGRM